jgi:NAD(P)-dependent dehydrogenase (short-subunit alcohol dehydrogenase family)
LAWRRPSRPSSRPWAAGGERRLAGIASVAGIRGLPGAEAYSASKAAAIAYLESLRLEMRPYGIKVVTIAPGYIETPMTAINPYKMPSCCRSTSGRPLRPPSNAAPATR